MPARKGKRQAEVILLEEARARRRLRSYQEQIAEVLESNQRTISGLYTTGALFSRQGARAGRDLLLAHQHLLKVETLLGQLVDVGARSARPSGRIEAVYEELDVLLQRTSTLTMRTGTYLARLRGE